MFLKQCMLICGGGSGHKLICGLTIYGINIARNRFLHWCNEEVDLKCGKQCWRTGKRLSLFYGGNQEVEPQQFEVQYCHHINVVGDFIKEDGWDYGAMQDVFLEHVIEHV
ncbi:hypothetical protein H5410_022223 [Solanum commersonii]|uniref:Uncharacterized protein n=1 Tax=Solanum commersonii TaxID=4109 RepID=A0A9J5ZIZ6_SOLCO|nr:hypothetical protein H5410_022223 [Solanum commersonii]